MAEPEPRNSAINQPTPLGQRSSNLNLPAQALLLSLIASAQAKNAEQVQIYLNFGNNSTKAQCYLKIAGRLQKSPKTFSSKVLGELVEHLKSLANLELSPAKLAQNAKLNLPQLGLQNLNLNLIQNSAGNEVQLTLTLNSTTLAQSFSELGFGDYNLTKLNVALQNSTGIILLDSLSPASIYNLTASILAKLKSNSTAQNLQDSAQSSPTQSNSTQPNSTQPGFIKSSLQFEESFFEDYNLPAHQRIFAKLNSENLPIIRQVLLSDPDVVIFADPADQLTLSLSLELAASGRLVILTTRTGSTAKSLKYALNLTANPTQLLQQLVLVASLRPIQALAANAPTQKLNADSLSALEQFFGIATPADWQTFLSLSKAAASSLQFSTSTNYSSLTNLVELLALDEDFKLSLSSRRQSSSEIITWLAIQNGMLTFRHDGLIKSLKKELNISDVISICST